MNYLLDTDICVYWLNGRSGVKDKLLAAGWKQVAISVITQAELYYGAYNSSRVTENLGRVDDFVSQVPILPLHDTTLKRFGALKAQLRQIGQPLPDFDLLIASIALMENRVLVTNNTRHYQRIQDLQLENWAS
ncbi:MAG: type II toxin-antitoxin system VapC family toxin [Anaerolineae bacterium]|nr:type II toxin-antitoxin system VapC family toxin [Anaerolineae bacterium]